MAGRLARWSIRPVGSEFKTEKSFMKNSLTRRMDPLIGKLELRDEADTGSLMQESRRRETPTILGFLNQHAYNIAERDPRIYESFFGVNYLLRDGVGI